MSKDIRSYFNLGAKKKDENTSNNKLCSSKPKRKANSLNSSDDEKAEIGLSDVKKKRRIIDSDDEQEKPKSKSKQKKSSPVKEKKKLVEAADVFGLFGSEPVKRKERPKVVKVLNQSSDIINLDEDDDLEISMLADEIEKQELEARALNKSGSIRSPPGIKTESSPEKKVKQEPLKCTVKDEKKAVKVESNSCTERSPKKHSVNGKNVKLEVSSPSLNKSAKKEPTSSKKEKKPKVQKETTVEEDEARHERKQAAAAMFHKFQNRAAVLNPGSKDIPKGKPDCLKGLQFVITGVLESMEREEAADLIKSCGGNVVSALSKKVTHLLVGEESGPAKLAKATDMGIKQLTEDELLSLIRKKSGLPEVSSLLNSNEGHKSSIKIEDVIVKEKPLVSSEVKVETKPSSTSSSSNAKPAQPTINMDDFSFVDRYKPTNIKQIIGQQGPTGHAQKLLNWLTKWHFNNDGKKKHVKPSPWAKDNDGKAFKAALLSGPPGVGKTTTAHLVANEVLFDIVEFNASDTRSKRLLKEEVSSLMSNKSLAGYLSGTDTKVSKRHVLIMDEVDGMAGNEDRGGVAELIALIKESRIPVICMCNDRNHPKIRSLANHCFDLRFNKPSVVQIRGAMMSVCFKEGIKLEAGAMDEIISGTGNDIRQTLNHLALYSASKDVKLNTNDAKKNAQMSEKDIKIGQFEVIRKVFSAEEHKKMTFNDKSDLFFHDYNIAPLFVQENYLHVKPNCDKSEVMARVAQAADSMSMGDLVEKRIRSNMAWSLLPTQAVFSSVLPGEYMEGALASAANFPSWLGKNSRANKRKRLAQEIHDHTRTSTSGSRLSVRLDYAPFLVQAIVNPLKEKGLEGIPQALEVIKTYSLLREDIDALLELTTWPKMKNPWESVDSKVKAALTRAYNKVVQPYSFSAQAGVKKKSAKLAESDEQDYENEEEAAAQTDDEEEEDSIENNALIKVKKPAVKVSKPETSSKTSATSQASSSKSGSSSKSATAAKPAKPKSKK